MRKENLMRSPSGSVARMCCASCENYVTEKNNYGKFTFVCVRTGRSIPADMYCSKYLMGKYFADRGFQPEKQ